MALSAAELEKRPITFRTGKSAAYLRNQKIEQLVADAILPVGSTTASMRLGDVSAGSASSRSRSPSSSETLRSLAAYDKMDLEALYEPPR